MNWIRSNSLIISIIGSVFLAWLTPEWGANNGKLHSEWLIKFGVVFIFFTQGLNLSIEAMLKGLANWPVHVFCQLWIFIGIPAVTMLGLSLFGTALPEGLRLGLFFLSILPTTISSAVALVTQAQGDTATAVFNTICANLSAVFILPLWIFWYQSNLDATSIEFWPILIKLIKLLLLPFFIGHIIRHVFSGLELHLKPITKTACQAIIIFMVYTAFATSFRDKIWTNVAPETAFTALISAMLLLSLVSLIVWGSSRILFKKEKTRISAFFVSSQKSLAVGIPYSVAFFATLSSDTDPSLKQSIVILPLLFYHPAQLILASVILRFDKSVFGCDKPSSH